MPHVFKLWTCLICKTLLRCCPINHVKCLTAVRVLTNEKSDYEDKIHFNNASCIKTAHEKNPIFIMPFFLSFRFSVVIEGERGNRPRIYSLEQLLQEAVSFSLAAP